MSNDLELAVEALKREDRRGPGARALIGYVDDVAAEAQTPPELLALTVGRAYGSAIWERDQARDVANRLADDLSTALTHLSVVLDALPEPSSFAKTNDLVADARAFLTAMEDGTTVGSAQTPEQEGSTP